LGRRRKRLRLNLIKRKNETPKRDKTRSRFAGGEMKTKKEMNLCQRCKREIDWEEKEMIKQMPKESLIQLVFAYQEAIKNDKPIMK